MSYCRQSAYVHLHARAEEEGPFQVQERVTEQLKHFLLVIFGFVVSGFSVLEFMELKLAKKAILSLYCYTKTRS